jgi:sugar lactone lactonase YvrE
MIRSCQGSGPTLDDARLLGLRLESAIYPVEARLRSFKAWRRSRARFFPSTTRSSPARGRPAPIGKGSGPKVSIIPSSERSGVVPHPVESSFGVFIPLQSVGPPMARATPAIISAAALAAICVAVLFVWVAPLAISTTLPRSSADLGTPLPGIPAASPTQVSPNPFSNGMAATVTIGQANLVSGGSGGGPTGLSRPTTGAAFDSAGDLWIVDTDNNRVVEYVPPFSTGMSASLVIGQTGLTGSHSNTTSSGLWEPAGVTFDHTGDLWIADSTNNRVLEFTPPFHDGMSASLVLGQSSFVTRNPGTSAANLTHPTGLAFNDTGTLFVADSVNNRVVAFDPPFSQNMAAAVVLGQSTFSGTLPATTATNLSDPTDVAAGPNGQIWVADSQNDRVVGYLAPLSDGMAASLVLGEPNLVTRSPSLPNGLAYPTGLGFDPLDNLWVADSGDSRVLEYTHPFGSSATPAAVEGQSTLTGYAGGTTAVNVSGPTIPMFDSMGDLWVVDSGNNRVLEYVPMSYRVTVSETGLPAGTTWTFTFSGAVQSAVAPASITYSKWNGTYVYVAGSVAGYSATPSSGLQLVNGAPVALAITYSGGTTSGGGSSGGWGSWWWLILVVIAIIVLVVVYLQRRRRRSNALLPPPAGADSVRAPSPPTGQQCS